MPFTATLDGDPEGGWIGETHDGQVHTVHHPVGDTLRMALSHMLHMHFGDNPGAAPAIKETLFQEPIYGAQDPNAPVDIKNDPATVNPQVASDGLPLPPRDETGKFVKSDPPEQVD